MATGGNATSDLRSSLLGEAAALARLPLSLPDSSRASSLSIHDADPMVGIINL